jgi:hypothetical protein
MKRLLCCLLPLLFSAASATAQVHSFKAFATWSRGVEVQPGFTSATAWGLGAAVRFDLGSDLFLTVNGGYEYYSLDQDSALQRWNWKFWTDRYAGIVQANLAADSALSATLEPVQSMETLPLMVTLGVALRPLDELTILTSLGAGVVFYTRSLYLQETWEKIFSSVDYTFGYTYRNFANDKKGNPIVWLAEVEASWQVSDLIAVDLLTRFTGVVRTPGSLGYDEFPLRNTLTIAAGISILY